MKEQRQAFDEWHYNQYLLENPNIDTSSAKYIYDYAHKNVLVWQIRESHFTAWQAAKAQAVQEQDQQVWATSNLTWKDIAFRALTCKVLKSTENWVHVKNIACVGSTTASLICKKLGVDPDGTKFELIEAQEQGND